MPPNGEPLVIARGRLTDAVRQLADPLPIVDTGRCGWLAPLYSRLRGSLRGQPLRAGRRVPDSRLPCRSDVLALLVEVDAAVAEWDCHGENTVERLRDLAGQRRRPMDCEQLDGYSARIEAWTLTGVELLGEQPTEVAIRLPCPACGKRFVYKPSGYGETVRQWALRVSEHGARCQGCAAAWTPDRFEWLARVLGCPELPT